MRSTSANSIVNQSALRITAAEWHIQEVLGELACSKAWSMPYSSIRLLTVDSSPVRTQALLCHADPNWHNGSLKCSDWIDNVGSSVRVRTWSLVADPAHANILRIVNQAAQAGPRVRDVCGPTRAQRKSDAGYNGLAATCNVPP
jgi:hypothetical protein